MEIKKSLCIDSYEYEKMKDRFAKVNLCDTVTYSGIDCEDCPFDANNKEQLACILVDALVARLNIGIDHDK